jgi:hypothetical protein
MHSTALNGLGAEGALGFVCPCGAYYSLPSHNRPDTTEIGQYHAGFVRWVAFEYVEAVVSAVRIPRRS